jgi:hypothetical protein
MTISPDLVTSLTAIGTVMDGANDPWWIIASAAVAATSFRQSASKRSLGQVA